MDCLSTKEPRLDYLRERWSIFRACVMLRSSLFLCSLIFSICLSHLNCAEVCLCIAFSSRFERVDLNDVFASIVKLLLELMLLSKF